MGQKIASRITKRYKNASRLNRLYTFRTVNAVGFLFSTLHTTPFSLCENIIGVLLSTVPTLRGPISHAWCSPQLQVGAFNSHQIRWIGTGVLSLLMCSLRLSVTEICCAK